MTGEVSSFGTGGHPKCMMVANIFISFIGAGILGLPKAFKTAGLLEGSIVMSIVAFLAVRYSNLHLHSFYFAMKKRVVHLVGL